MRVLLLLFAASVLLSGCSPGLVLNLYNATDDILSVTTSPFRRVIPIPPNTAQDIGIAGDVLIRNSRHSWKYSSRSLDVPISLYQQHTMLWRAFGKIDSAGQIYLFAPPRDHGTPRKIPQPRGFPLRPRQT
jgi:uncharacterized protein YceK